MRNEVCQYGCSVDQRSMLFGLYNRVCRESMDQNR
jgi:hypothetical protein